MREIGSEFWKPRKQHIRDDETFYLSGRTALDVIVRDAMEFYGITSVLLPSYCCHTMIEPFLTNGIKLHFYDVYVDDDGVLTADIPVPRKNEMLYIMKYFGDTDLRYRGEGQNLSGWTATVEDLTHTCFSLNDDKGDNESCTTADYWFTSYRKWFGVAGIAVAGKRNGKLLEPGKGRNQAYSNLRDQAFLLKQQFMDGMHVEKQKFLDLFGKAEQFLEEDYKDFGVGYEDIYDLFCFLDGKADVCRKRQENAKILIDRLTGINGIKVVVDFNDDKKCPLFVPIIINNGMRDSLRKYLISKDIYCPVHWPLSDQHKGITKRAAKIYREELSLLCDHRYNADDMERIINEIHKFLRAK
ncbi:hypothetical protein V6B71_03415 [Mediterraneibacter gnavus]|uniref:hypothetical protein n=1 Tax=Mediterraneibacter gnavus TaxID=33038 RepID=UPI0011847A30|nr:hypothetical protein [Mediterraneibacter gnavus]